MIDVKNVEIKTIFRGNESPEVVTKKVGKKYYTYVPYILSEENGEYTWEYVVMLAYKYSYEGVVEALIAMRYNNNEVIAIMNNYLSEPKNLKYKKEFAELQEWRLTSKNYAKKHFGLI